MPSIVRLGDLACFIFRRYHITTGIFLVCLLASTCLGEDRLRFQSDGSTNLLFDTGIVKGTLVKDGTGDGLRHITFLESNLAIDGNHGLFVPYRFLTPQKRYGFGSWEWSRTGQILENGAAELRWPETIDRPFNLVTVYRWQAADTLDLTVFFTAKTSLDQFELFLGSYFQNFTKAKVYVRDIGDGIAGFAEASKDKGDMQFFPKSESILPMVKDGRWDFQPYPMHWTIRDVLGSPLGMKIEPKSGATVLIMSPPEESFGISMSQEEAKLGGYYISLFGKSVQPNQTLIGHARLVFGKNLSDDTALQKYADYIQSLKASRDGAPMTDVEKESLKEFSLSSIATPTVDWASTDVPKPDAEGWITLFDGKHLYGSAPSIPDILSGKISVQNGLLTLNSTGFRFNIKGSDMEVRAVVKKLSGQNCNVTLRDGDLNRYLAWFNGGEFFGIMDSTNEKGHILATGYTAQAPKDFTEIDLRVEGKKLTFSADGKMVCDAWDDAVVDGAVGVHAFRSVTVFKSIQVRMLNGSANKLVSSDALTPPAQPADGLILSYDFKTPPVGGKIMDESGRGNDGRAVGVQWVADEHRGGAINFGISSSYITVPNNDDLNPRQITMAAWIKTSYKDRVWRRIFDKGTGKGYVLSMCADAGNKSFRGEVDIEPGKTFSHSGVTVTDGEWHYVVGTYDGEDAKMYVDGWAVGQPGHLTSMLARTPYDLTIGANRSNPVASAGEVDASFNGMMSGVMMYNRALSLAEIRALFASQGGVLGSAPAQPTAVTEKTSKPTATERLKQLKELLDQGLIKKEDYDRKVKEIVDAI